jgi:hypothetical protein
MGHVLGSAFRCTVVISACYGRYGQRVGIAAGKRTHVNYGETRSRQRRSVSLSLPSTGQRPRRRNAEN